MKELSVEEKAKRYDEAIEQIKECNPDENGFITIYPQEIFPELKESEDESIRKDIISYLKSSTAVSPKAWIAWLEKQGTSYTKRDVDDAYLKGVTDTKNEIEKQYEANYQIRKDIGTFIFNYRGDIKDRAKWMDYLGIKVSFVEKQGKQKHIPKHKIGDTIYYYSFGKVESMIVANVTTDSTDNPMYEDKEGNAVFERALVEQNPAEFGDNRSKELSLSLQIQAYLNTASDELYAKGKPLYSEERIKDIHKCMLMWQRLHNVYFYQKPAWSEEDETVLNNLIWALKEDMVLAGDRDEYVSWLQSLKDKTIPQPKQECSEEDERLFQIVIDILDRENHLGNISHTDLIACVRKLKSIRPQNWKPGDEQIECLSDAIEHYNSLGYPASKLKELLEDLKKLREEKI